MAEYFEIFLPGEKPHADTILKRMGEYDKCLLTGDTEELTSIPADFNPSNIMPSNMARISKKFLEASPVVIDYEIDILTCHGISITVGFRSFYQFYKYNKNVIKESINPEYLLSKKQIDFLVPGKCDERFNGSALTEVFWNLTTHHVKGIDKVSLRCYEVPKFSMDWSAFQAFVMGDLERRKPKSNIITPAFGSGY